MKLLLKIAFLNLWRRKSRSFLVILMVAMSITGMILMQGLFKGMIQQMIDNSIRSDTGHIAIYQKGYRISKSLEDQIEKPNDVVAYIKKQGEVLSVIQRVRQEGLVATAKQSQGAVIVGTNLEEENKHSNLKNYLKEGKYSFGKRNRGALIGKSLAAKLKVRVGKKIIITLQDKSKEIQSLALKVRGIYQTNNAQMDKSGVIVDRDLLRSVLGLTNQSTQISVMVDKPKNQKPLIAKIQKQFTNTPIEVKQWKELFPMFDQIDQMQGAFFGVTYMLIFIIAGIGIFGVILVSVLERVREFGVMLAIGAGFSRVKWQIITESVFLGLLGLVVGSLIGGLLLYYFSTTGIDLSSYSEGMAQFGMDATIKAEFHVEYFIYSGTAVVLATFFAALWPIRVLRKKNPIEAVNA